MRLIIGSLALALALTPPLITVGAADSRGIPAEGAVACNEVCKQWMAAGDRASAGSRPAVGPGTEQRSTFVARYVHPVRSPDKRKSPTRTARAAGQPGSKTRVTASVQFRKKSDVVATLPVRPAPSSTAVATPSVGPIPAVPAPPVPQHAAPAERASVQAGPPSSATTSATVDGQVEARAGQAVRVGPPPAPVAEAVAPAAALAALVGRPLLTVSGRLEATFLLAALLAMVLSFQRLIGPGDARAMSPRLSVRRLGSAAVLARS